MKNAIVLCSGGIDSAVTAHFVKKKLEYDKIKILFFDYGQRALEMERKSSMNCASAIGGQFKEIKLEELGSLSWSLINKPGKIENLSREDLKNSSKESEKWYVPCRNTLFLVYALTLAESEFIKSGEVADIFVGFKCEGNESFPDTTKEFVSGINELSKISCNGKFEIKAPLIEMDKEDIIQLGKDLGADLKETWSCYLGLEKQCGTCLACMLRKEGFSWANVEDYTEYQTR